MKTILTGQFFKIDQYQKKIAKSTAAQRLNAKLIPFSIATSIPRGFEEKVPNTIQPLVPPIEWVRWYHSYKNSSTQIRQEVLKTYERRYKAYLYHNVSADEVYQAMMTAQGKYDIPILLCWEREDYPCHRHWAAAFFKYFGYDCYEFQL